MSRCFSYAISLVWRLKYPYTSFSSLSWFQGFIVVLFVLMLAIMLLATAIFFLCFSECRPQVLINYWFICLGFSSVHFKNDPEFLTRETAQVLIPLMIFLQKLSRSSEIVCFSFVYFCFVLFFVGFFFFCFFLFVISFCFCFCFFFWLLFFFFFFAFFFHLSLFRGFYFQYSYVLVIFLLFKCSDSFLIWLFFSFRCLSFSTFPYEQGTFFNVKFSSYILNVYSYCLYQNNNPDINSIKRFFLEFQRFFSVKPHHRKYFVWNTQLLITFNLQKT